MPILAYFLLHFAIYTLFRAIFLIWNWGALKTLSVSELLQAFSGGVRFDLAAIAATAGICFLGLIWLSRNRILKWLWGSLFLVINCLFILVNLVDIELVNFTARRFAKSALFLVQEGNFAILVAPYLVMGVVTLTLVLVYAWFFISLISKIRFSPHSLKNVSYSLLTLILIVIAFRGGVQHKPMTFVDAKLFANPMANHLVSNSTFSFLKSLSKAPIAKIHYYEQKEMLSFLNQPQASSFLARSSEKLNVVIIIVESLSKEYLELKNPEFTPYLNSLKIPGKYFPNFYANARRSIEGIGAILAGIPALMEDPFINSEFSANEFIGLGSVLSKVGYHTSFFHAANKGSMHLDAFATSLGIQNYFGKSEYPHAGDEDGAWGIFDGPFLKWNCQKLSTFSTPFLTTIFTLSSHPPYKLPDNELSIHPDGSHPVLKSIHYTDQSIKHFMDCAQVQKWYQNTLFVFTGDHAGPSLNLSANFKSKFEIPLILYSPNSNLLKSIDANQFGQQIDILPTILETLNVEQKAVSYLSRSLWQPGHKIVPLYADGEYELVGDVKDAEKQLNSVRQYFSEAMLDNRLYYPVGSSTK